MSNFPDTEKPRFVYWKANSRALAPMLMLDAAGIEYVWDDATANTWPKPKSDLPFGQLPYYIIMICVLHNQLLLQDIVLDWQN